MNETRYLPFTCAVAVSPNKRDDGKWLFNGPIGSLKEDYDRDKLERSDILKGIQMFWKLGRHIDFEHMYKKTLDLSYIIGQAQEIIDVGHVPSMIGELFQHPGKPMAKAVWDHMEVGGECGLSLDGLASINPSTRKRVVSEIHMVTISPRPKGFDARIAPGRPPIYQTLMAKGLDVSPDVLPLYEFAKSLVDDMEMDHLDNWMTETEMEKAMATFHSPGTKVKLPNGLKGIITAVRLSTAGHYYRVQTDAGHAISNVPHHMCHVCKALTTGSGIVTAGETGGAALRTQAMGTEPSQGAPKSTSNLMKCSGCGRMNRKSRTVCPRCKRALHKEPNTGGPRNTDQSQGQVYNKPKGRENFEGVGAGYKGSSMSKALTIKRCFCGGGNKACSKCNGSGKQTLCPHCNKFNPSTGFTSSTGEVHRQAPRTKCKFCNKPMEQTRYDLTTRYKPLQKSYIGFDKLKSKLASKYGEEGAAKIAASIARKKYGSRRVQQAAARGKKMRGMKTAHG
jgi:hypothetical protein